jgi:hypothetical protein
MQLIDSKSLLAKLMATENLTVEQRDVPTASFDVLNRILTIPVLDKNISSELYDLFAGHEVGHALYTPLDGMKAAKDSKINMSVVNVVEDSRIERKIKYKYPGLKSSFLKAYNELVEKNFFGTKGKNLDLLNLIDRINLHCKGGAHLNIKFNEIERDLLNDVENTETYDDVIEVSKRIIEYMLEQLEQQKSKNKSSPYDEEDDDFDLEFTDELNPHSGENDFDDFDKNIENDNFEASDEDLDDGDNSSDMEVSSDLESKTDSEIRSFTDEAYRQNESKLFVQDPESYVYGNIPKIDIDKLIYDYKDLYKRYKQDEEDGFVTSRPNDFMKIRRESDKVVSYLVKEFEMRKNADQLKRASTAKTGDLDMKKIFSYGFNEDIFKKVTVVPGGKSHGLVMFLDWSGSMHDHIANTVKQLINLVLFCKKVNIPYEVYTFVEDVHDRNYNSVYKKGDLNLRPFGICNILSSRMSASEFTYAGGALVAMSGAGQRKYRTPYWMTMAGTPLNEAIITAMEIVPAFQKKYKLQIVNTVFLTDGEGGMLNSVFGENDQDSGYYNRYNDKGKKQNLVFRDPVTKHQEFTGADASNRMEQTNALIRLLKKRTNSNIIGFYVMATKEFNRGPGTMLFPDYIERMKLKEEFRKDKFLVVKNTGFDEYYLLRSNGLDTEEDATFEVKDNATKRGILSAFSKYAGNRINNRVILNRFIKLIA